MTAQKLTENFNALSNQILHYANRDIPKTEFLRKISKILMNFSGCDVVELWIEGEDNYDHCKITSEKEYSFLYEDIHIAEDKQILTGGNQKGNAIIGRLRIDILREHFDPSLPVFTSNGSFWTGALEKSLKLILKPDKQESSQEEAIDANCKSLALIPLFTGVKNIGILELISKQANFFTEKQIVLYENVAKILWITLMNRRAQEALRERVKELSCLYKIANLPDKQETSLSEILRAIVSFIPSAWQYPEITTARIILDGQVYSTAKFQQSGEKQVADIVVKDDCRGFVEVTYTKIKLMLDEGPFLKEERNLINEIARQIAQIVERKEAAQVRLNLQEQIRHADRLATIGQLAAGVAHELNEPLANILGFAQLSKKTPELPEQVNLDLENIVKASLHAREVIKKLMLFARQMPQKSAKMNVNEVVEEGLYFFEARCVKSGIDLVRSLSPEIPEISGDQSQLNQVLINLVVNSIQAMPDGGTLTIQTKADKKSVSIIVEDTGIGMSEDVMKKIFLPFFTTKDVNEGTGLGLAVVHGIVSAHAGSIFVESHVGQGTKFEVQLPVKPKGKKKEKK